MEEEFDTKDGRTVRISIDEVDFTARVTTVPEGQLIGSIEFAMREIDERQPHYLHMTRCYLDLLDSSWKYQGIGRRCLELVREFSGMVITASDHDGLQKDDGSHLTGDAPGFVDSMREAGLIEGGQSRANWEEDDD